MNRVNGTALRPVVEITDAVVNYGRERPALDRATLRVIQGETVAVLGANGSGKSTMIRAALGLVPLESGTVRLFGTPLRRFRDWQKIGYVPQRIGAGNGVPATVRELVAAGRLARRGLFRPATAGDWEAVDAAIAAVGLSVQTRDPVASLSGGQQQRALIARALAGGPELLILDEPTVGVDAGSQQSFAGVLRRFVADGGSVLLVTHELGPLEPLVSRAVVLRHGTVVHDGPIATGAAGQEPVHPHAPAVEGLFPDVVRSREP